MAEIGVSGDKCSKDLNILLIGKSGNGVTSVANTIFWKKKICTPTSHEINTYQGSVGTHNFMGRNLTVIDTPGIVETKSKKSRIGLIQQLTKAISICPKGYHAFLLVLKFGNRLSEEDKNIFRVIKAIFGERVNAKYCILIMTYGDNFHIQKECMNVKTFDEWSKKQEGVLKTMLEDCCNRIILFDNYSKEENSRALLTDQLIMAIDLLEGDQYTLNDFQNAAGSRQSIIVELKIPRLREKVVSSLQRLLDDYTKAQRVENAKKKFDLELILHLAKRLQEKINRDLKATNLYLEETKQIEDFINKVQHDVLKEQEEKQKETENSKLLEKTVRVGIENELKELKNKLETDAVKAQIIERKMIDENNKMKEKLAKSKETENELQLQLKLNCEEMQTQLQNLIESNKQAMEKGAKDAKLEIEKNNLQCKKLEDECILKLEDMKKEKKQMSKQIKHLEKVIAKLNYDLHIAKEEVENLKSEIQQIENDKRNQSENVNTKETPLKKQLENRAKDLQKHKEDAALGREKKIQELESENANLQHKIREMEIEIKSLQKKISK